MKKVFYIAAIATLSFLSCQREEQDLSKNDVVSEGFTFKASIEQLATKGDINDNNKLVWAQGDKIGIYVNDEGWNDHNQPFHLTSNGGSTEGEFAWDYGTFDNPHAAAAFFPWDNGNNVSYPSGIMYFTLPTDYSNYTSGKMMTPIVSSLSGSTDPIHFKHAGAAVKVTINNLPAGAHSMGMSVEGQQITGYYHIDPAQAGTSGLTVNNGAADNTQNSLWLNIDPADTEREFTFIFPVPALTTPKLRFNIYDENDVLVWSKKLKAQSSNLARADILAMPPIDITPYSQFNTISEGSDGWVLRGKLEHNDWTYDVGAITDGTTYIVKGVKVVGEGNDCAVKIKHPGSSWDGSWPSGNYIITSGPGTYDIIFNPTTQEIKAVSSKCPYPDANVSLYFSIDRECNDIRFKSDDLGTAGWPGDAPVGIEILGGKKFYKWVIPAIRAWGTTASYSLVDAGYWSADSNTFTFTGKKTAYFFHMDSNKTITEISKPEEPTLSIDGSFNDWSVLTGNSYGPNSNDNTSTIKAYVQDVDNETQLFIYLKVEGTYDLSSGRYVRFYFDTDNNKSTGASDWYRKGADAIPTGLDSFLVYFNHSGSVANADIQGIGSNYQLKVAAETGYLEAELCVPISVLGTITGDTVNLFCLGYFPSEFSGSLAGVIVP